MYEFVVGISKNGQHMYDDTYVPDDGLDKVIEEVDKYY